jgi:ABC-type branched-subunit amino acid transport system ATPase component/ABC-type branched-subunit amino acid transport system permease subunit
LATISALSAVSLMGLNLIFGYCGMLVLGQAAFSAVASYACIMIFNAGAPSLVAIAVGLVTAVAAARVLAGIFIRLPGIYLAVGTLGFAYVTEGLIRALPGITGGASGLVLASQLKLTDNAWYAIAVTVLLVAVLSMRWLLSGKLARSLQLLQRDEMAAEVVGIDVARLKIRMFTIGAAYTAAGAVVLSQYVGVVSPEMGGATTSLEYLAMVIIGGAGSLMGPLVGSVIVHWLFAASGAAHEYELLIFGFCFLIIVLFAPRGVVGLFQKASAHLGMGKLLVADDVADHLRETSEPVALSRVGPRLAAQRVTKSFGGLKAVNAVSLSVRGGEVVALLGPNGAGKSTFFNLLSGIEAIDSGEILLGGEDISRYPIHRRSRLIGRSFQVPRLVGDMTVLQNILVRVDQLLPNESEEARLSIAMHQLQLFDLEAFARVPVQEIAIGLHKLIDFARAAVGDPPAVLLDEPGVGLSPDELTKLRTIIEKLKARGAAVVIVDHNIEFILSVSDRILVMESGAPISLGSPAEVLADQHVQRAYLGAFA